MPYPQAIGAQPSSLQGKPNQIIKSLPCFLLFSLPYQLTQDVMGHLGDNKLELERKEEPQDGCVKGE